MQHVSGEAGLLHYQSYSASAEKYGVGVIVAPAS